MLAYLTWVGLCVCLQSSLPDKADEADEADANSHQLFDMVST